MSLEADNWPKQSRAAVKTLAIVLGVSLPSVLGTAAFMSATDERIREKAADVATKTVAPVAARLDAHVAQQEATERALMQWVEEDRAQRRLTLQKLDALCRATPKANCPLGQ